MISEERQDIFSLSTSFFTHLYFTRLPWRIPLSEVPHESPSLFCTLNILSFLRIFSICLCPLWPPNLLTHPSSSKGDNLFFLFKYFCLVLKSHHESQFPFHSYYTLFLLFSISGFHFNPSDASVSCPWSPVKSILISSCAFPLDHHPPTSVTLSARTLKFFHSPLWKLCLSPCLLVPLLLSQWPPACSCPPHQICLTDTWQGASAAPLPSSFSPLPADASPVQLLLPLLFPGTPRGWQASQRTKSFFWILAFYCSSATPYLPGCSHSTLWWENYLSWGEN